jgi:thiamine biosynthesis lipoprotein
MAQPLDALLELGFTQVDPPAVTCEIEKIGKRKYRIVATRPAMGTLVSLAMIHSSRDRAEEAVGRAFEEISRLTGILSRHDDSAALAYLNRVGLLADVPPELNDVVQRALYYNTISLGSFDISVKPLVDLLEGDTELEDRMSPEPEKVKEALELTGLDNLKVTEHSIQFTRQGMGLTLDGIAKGYIVDRAAEVLEKNRIGDYLINAGGDIRAAGNREDRKPWTVAVQDPSKSGDFPDIIHLSNRAVATSGGYEIYFDPRKEVHHIVDSVTGMSPNMNLSVSVVAPTTMAADALATTLFLITARRGIELIESLSGYEALIVDRKGSQMKTRGWRSAAR